MANNGENPAGWRGSRWRIAAWGIAALILLLPLVAMRFTDEVTWDEEDFIFAGVLIGAVGFTYELTVRMTRNWAHRAAVALALAATFLIIWANGAVGMIGSEGNPFNLLFYGVILMALVGAVAAGFRPAGMARVMVVAGIAQVSVAFAGLSTDMLGGVLSAVFAGPWLLSAALFWKAAREQSPVPAAP